ncbi:MAG: hypothetical protein ABEJ87_02320 [Candidatus Nanohalobium sp.]
MATFHLVFEFSVAVLAALIGLGAGRLFLNIRENKDSVMTRFKLRSDQTYHDFVLFFIAEILLLGTFITYVIAGLTDAVYLMDSARVLLILFLSMIAYGVLRMWVISR